MVTNPASCREIKHQVPKEYPLDTAGHVPEHYHQSLMKEKKHFELCARKYMSLIKDATSFSTINLICSQK